MGSLAVFAALSALTAAARWNTWPASLWWSLGQAAGAAEAADLAFAGSGSREERAIWAMLAAGASVGAALAWPGVNYAGAGRLMWHLWLALELLAALASIAGYYRYRPLH